MQCIGKTTYLQDQSTKSSTDILSLVPLSSIIIHVQRFSLITSQDKMTNQELWSKARYKQMDVTTAGQKLNWTEHMPQKSSNSITTRWTPTRERTTKEHE